MSRQMPIRGVSIALIASMVLSGPLGCETNPVGKPLKDPEAERERLGRILTQRHLSPDDQYIVRVHLQEAETKTTGRFQPSIYAYQSVVQLKPKRPEAKVSFARMVAAMQDRYGAYAINENPQLPAQAITWISQVIDKEPDKGDYYLLRAQCSRGSSDTKQRAADLDHARQLRPTDPQVLIEQGRLSYANGDSAAASTQLNSALAMASASPHEKSEAHALLGRIAQEQRQATEATKEYDLALQENPENADALYGRAMYYWAAHDLSSFQTMVTRVQQVVPSTALASFSAGLQNMDYDDARHREVAYQWMSQASDADPKNPVFPAMIDEINAKTEASNKRQNEIAAGVVGLLGLVVVGAVAHDIHMNDRPELDLVNPHGRFVGEDYYLTFNNKKGGGKTLIDITEGNQEWKRIFYMEGGEQKEIGFHLPGLTDGNIHSTWQPAEGASNDDLRGAQEQ